MSAKNHYRVYREWTLADPEVLAILTGLRRFARNAYFKIGENGEHAVFRAHSKLRALPTSTCAATRLLRAAEAAGLIVWADYIPPKKEPSLATTIGLDDRRVVAVLAGVSRSGERTYYRDGNIYPLRRRIMDALGVSRFPADKLIKLAITTGLIPVMAKPAKPERRCSARRINPEEGARLPEPEPQEGDDDEDGEESIAPDEKELKRYELVFRRGSGWFGVFDREHNQETLVSKDKQEALERIYELQRYPDDSHFRWNEARAAA